MKLQPITLTDEEKHGLDIVEQTKLLEKKMRKVRRREYRRNHRFDSWEFDDEPLDFLAAFPRKWTHKYGYLFFILSEGVWCNGAYMWELLCHEFRRHSRDSRPNQRVSHMLNRLGIYALKRTGKYSGREVRDNFPGQEPMTYTPEEVEIDDVPVEAEVAA